MPRGGKRPGAGRPKGSKEQGTLDKELARAHLRELVTAKMTPLVEAQIANAMGIKYLVVRQKTTGKFVRVSEAMARISDGEELIEVWEKDPSQPAFTDLMNRTIDQPAKPAEEANVNLNAAFRWLRGDE